MKNEKISDSVYKTFGNKVRIRICGLCQDGERLLLVKHKGLTDGDFWAPPGGGLQFGETIEDCLMREFAEETGLSVTIGHFKFVCEVLIPPLHAIELFYSIDVKEGILTKGTDPEMDQNQIIEEVKYMSWTEIDHLPAAAKHGIFNKVSNSSKIVDLKGHFKL